MNNSKLNDNGFSGDGQNAGNSRRSFIKKTAAAAVILTGTDLFTMAVDSYASKKETQDKVPWYRRVTRWGQTNITEKDPAHYDVEWWRKHWKDTQTQGVIINAGGIVAYYPSHIPLHHQAQYLEGRDLFNYDRPVDFFNMNYTGNMNRIFIVNLLQTSIISRKD